LVKIEFDSAKNKANLAKHGVDMAAAMDFDFETATTAVDNRRQYGEERIVALGLIGQRLYILVYTMRGKTLRVISLRKANAKERKAFRGN
jgi:uncharacterized DUF497 family protein